MTHNVKLRQLGGYSVHLDSRNALTGSFDLVCFDPPKMEMQSTGCVIVFHGEEMDQSSFLEWSMIAKLSQWHDLGLSVVIPSIVMHSGLSADDISSIIDASLRYCRHDQAILLGKGWGGNICIKYACEIGKQKEKVKGLILHAPHGPPHHMIHEVECPVMLMWNADDDIVPFEESGDWAQHLNNRPTGSCIKNQLKCKVEKRDFLCRLY